MTLLRVHEVSQTLCPSVLKFYEDFDKFIIVFQLWVDHFDVLFILLQKVAEVHEALLDALC